MLVSTIAGVYQEKASGARADRHVLLRMIADLRPSEVVIAKSIDHISRLPLEETENLFASIRATLAKLSVPGIGDLSDITAASNGVAMIVLDNTDTMAMVLPLCEHSTSVYHFSPVAVCPSALWRPKMPKPPNAANTAVLPALCHFVPGAMAHSSVR